MQSLDETADLSVLMKLLIYQNSKLDLFFSILYLYKQSFSGERLRARLS